jgi:hypothetical protein
VLAVIANEITSDEFFEITRRNARCVQTLVGWIFWDPGAVSRFEELGLNGPLGYIAARAAPFAGAGAQAVAAAFGSISADAISLVFSRLGSPEGFRTLWDARNAAVLDGLRAYAPDAANALASRSRALSDLVDRLPRVGRPFFASHLDMDQPEHPILRG